VWHADEPPAIAVDAFRVLASCTRSCTGRRRIMHKAVNSPATVEY
jgi:hypothetical protein